MTVFSAILVGLAMGVVFGFALEKSRVFEPGMIVGQMQFRNFIMLKIFLTAVATGLVVLSALHGLGVVKLHPKATLYAADLVGGALLGIGISIAGACPGTVFAQIGVGYRDAWATLTGGLCGAVAFSYLQPALAPYLLSGAAGTLTFDGLLGLPFEAVALPFAGVLVVGLVWLEKLRSWRSDLGKHHDGLISEAPARAHDRPAAAGCCSLH